VIRIGPATSAALEALVDAKNATWRTRAAARTTALVAAATYNENTSIWGEIKSVFMVLQHHKCVFCERPLGGEEVGSVEHDLEHFRPKNRVKAWPSAKKRRALGYAFPTGAATVDGYYWLAYDLANYAAACKSCNSALKSNYFPILGMRGTATANVAALNASEQPLLLYPVGQHGDDPAHFLTFEGIVAVPSNPHVVAWQRAKVTIDFFRLNTRAELRRGRFEVIRATFLASQLAALSPDAAIVAHAKATLSDVVSAASPHSACAKAYLGLMRTDPDAAYEIYVLAERAHTR
jgi:hypothetical protein